MRRFVTIPAALAMLATTALAQPNFNRVPTIDSGPRPPARAEDVSSPDAIIRALYDVISGPAGQKRDWDRMRSLFIPNARLMPAAPRPTGGAGVVMFGVEDYITVVGPSLERGGFYERELKRVEERFGNVMHVFSTYDSKRTLADPEPFARGINSIQLLKDGDRWWVVSIFWQSETPEFTIPARYLP